MRFPLLAAVISAALSANAGARSFNVHLLEPASGAGITAGSAASIAWEASAVPANVEEWEAFISIDGGRSFPVRVTPHLDLAVRRFQWTVPDLPGAEISVLLRFGDEQEEHRFVFPVRSRIARRARGAPPIAPTEELGARRELDLIEENAAAWTEGTRAGTFLRSVILATSSFTRRAAFDSQRGGEIGSALAPRSRRDPTTPEPLGDFDVGANRATGLAAHAPVLPFIADILLMSRRRNI